MVKMVIEKATAKNKKFKAIFFDDQGKKLKTVQFGSAGMSDFTIHKDKERRARYRKRHKKDLDTKDFKRAGYLSYYILWGDSSDLQTAIKDYKSRFKLKP